VEESERIKWLKKKLGYDSMPQTKAPMGKLAKKQAQGKF
jgi:hypothetical protein